MRTRPALLATLMSTLALSTPVAAAPAVSPTSIPLPSAAMPVAPKPYRLEMRVTMLEAGDAHEGPGNTEDEIYFALAGMTEIKGVEEVRIRRTVRPQISRDFWEMGTHSADDFEATLFEGALGTADSATFGVLLGEQDNKALSSLVAVFTLAATALIERMAVDLAVGEETSQLSMDKLSSEVNKLATQMMTDGDELMGAVEVMVRKGKLRVKTPAGTFSTVLSSTDTTASVRLSGGGGKYRLDFKLEDRSAPAPLTQTFLSREQDACSAANLYVEKKGGGTVAVLKGDGGVPVRVKDDVFHWHCGGMAEDDQTNAPNDTKLVEVTRASSGSAIRWDCYHEATAAAQYVW